MHEVPRSERIATPTERITLQRRFQLPRTDTDKLKIILILHSIIVFHLFRERNERRHTRYYYRAIKRRRRSRSRSRPGGH